MLAEQTILTSNSVPVMYPIRHKHWETYDTFTVELEPPTEPEKFNFASGQFNMLYSFGVGEVPISISGDPSRPEKLVHTIRVVGAVTEALSKLTPGESMGVRGPFGSVWPLAEMYGHDVVIVAGGLGLAPLRPTLYEILANRKAFGKVSLLYGARTPADLLYLKQVLGWLKNNQIRVELTVDSLARPVEELEEWPGKVGVVSALIPKADFDPQTAIALVCGPEIMMRFTLRELQTRGVSPQQIYLSMERNMKCGMGWCGHCQWGPFFVCKDGPVFCFDTIKDWFYRREV